MWIFRPSNIHWKKVRGNNVDFSIGEIISKNVRGNNVDFSTIEIPSKKDVEGTWIFRPAKLHRKKYVETTWIFRPSKLHRKSTWKWRGNSSKFGLRCIDVISTSNRRGFDMEGGHEVYLLCWRKNFLVPLRWLSLLSVAIIATAKSCCLSAKKRKRSAVHRTVCVENLKITYINLISKVT